MRECKEQYPCPNHREIMTYRRYRIGDEDMIEETYCRNVPTEMRVATDELKVAVKDSLPKWLKKLLGL